MLARNRPKKLELLWGARPIRSEHQYLGTKVRWIERCRIYEVVRFTGGIGDYLVFRGGQRISVKKSLSGAKRAAEKDARANHTLPLRIVAEHHRKESKCFA